MSLQIQLKKSAVSQKQPFASDLAVGELALNYNADGPFLTCKDTAGNVRKLNNVWVGATAPTAPSAGDLWLDTSSATPVLKVYKDAITTWVGATSVPLATTTVFGTVRLASAADVTNGTSGKVVDAAQLQSKVAAEISSALNASPTTIQDLTVSNNATITGNLTVNGTTTTIDTTNLLVEDKNIEMGVVATPTDTTADGGGITLRGTTNKTINWVNATGAWTSSERFSYPLGTAAAPTITFTGDPNTGIYSPGADQLAISTNGTGRLFVGANGSVGIGLASTNDTLLAYEATDPAIRVTDATVNAYYAVSSSSQLAQLNVSSAHPLRIMTSGSERLRITSDGKLGVGTSLPDALLTVNGVGAHGLGSAAAPSFAFTGDLNTGIYSPGANQLAISTNGTGRLFVDSIGRVGIGKTPVYELDVAGSILIPNTQALRGLSSTNADFRILTVGADDNLYLGGNEAGSNESIVFRANDSERMRLDSSGRLGLGTSSPSSPLTIRTASGNDAQVEFSGANAGRGLKISTGSATLADALVIYDAQTSTGEHQFKVNGSDAVRITNAGRVGIGTTSPLRLFTAVDSANSIVARIESGQSSSWCQFAASGNGTASRIGSPDGSATASLAFITNDTERARIDSSGRLLVGTSTSVLNGSSVAGKIQVADNVAAAIVSLGTWTANANGSVLVLGKSRSTTPGSYSIVSSGDLLGSLRYTADDGTDLATQAASIECYVDGTPGANDMPGRLVFSTTANGASSPTERIRVSSFGQVNTYSTDSSLILRNSNAAGTTYAFIAGIHSATGTVSGGTVSFRVYNNGDVQNTNNSYGPISSDERLKQDIVDAGTQWDDIKAVRLTKFRYKNDPTGELQLGPIAQELEQVSPGLITRRSASEDEIADPSNDLVDGDEVLSFKASILYMKAVKALQEAMERIETLEAEVAALKAS